MALVLDWLQAEQPGELIYRAVEALRSGELVSFPTEAGYVAAAASHLPDAVGRLAALEPSGAEPLIVGAAADVDDLPWLPFTSAVADRLARRCWPGPVALTYGAGEFVGGTTSLPDGLANVLSNAGSLSVWSPAHTAAQAVIMSAPFRVLLKELGEAVAGESVAVQIDAGRPSADRLTRVRVGRGGWRLERAGLVSEEKLTEAAARWVVFVCTGNTCRSPMAEALCKQRLAARLGCAVADLPGRGYNVLSAGVAACPDDGAAAAAVQVCAGLGADLSGHRSRPLTEDLLRQADHLIAMTRGHLLAVLGRYPATSASLSLLCGRAGDLDDPIGAGPEVYEACAGTIARHLDRLIEEWTVR